jgi:hypothetical protein
MHIVSVTALADTSLTILMGCCNLHITEKNLIVHMVNSKKEGHGMHDNMITNFQKWIANITVHNQRYATFVNMKEWDNKERKTSTMSSYACCCFERASSNSSPPSLACASSSLISCFKGSMNGFNW